MLRKCALRRSSGKEGYPMLKFHSEQGEISVSSAVFSNITGMAATNCFGVKGMAYRSMTDGPSAAAGGHEQGRQRDL
jgi:uncharacterized alkaline shock family protein YloU